MAYKKFLVDNISCNRRFHVAFDEEETSCSQTKVECSYCGAVLLERKDHPKFKVVRDEILVKTTKLSPYRSKSCQQKDLFPPKER